MSGKMDSVEQNKSNQEAIRQETDRWTWVELYAGMGSVAIPVCKLCGCMVPFEMKQAHEAKEPQQ